MVTLSCAGQDAPSAANQRRTAIALEQQGENADAEIAWRAVLKAQPSSAEAYAHLGFLEARQEHYAEAVELYRRALALDPEMPSLRLNLGLSLFKSGALKPAVEVFAPLLKSLPASSPDLQRVTVLIGMSYYGLGEYADAIPYLKEAADRDAQSLELRLTLAQSCMQAKQLSCILDAYHQILSLNAESAEADMLAGEALEEMRDDPAAIQQFQAAVKANPKEPDVHFGLGYLLWKLKRYPEAADQFQAELANVPDHVYALAYLADAKIQLQDTQAALPLLQEAIRLDPKMELAHVDLATLYSDAHHQDDAVRELTLAAGLNPDDASVHWKLARLYQAMGKGREARAEIEKTRSLHQAEDTTVFHQLNEARAEQTVAGKLASK
jgi:tetratricopeptide (TPR) repeat protein